LKNENWPRYGRLAWATLGVLALAFIAGVVLRELALVVVPLLLALFPATLLVPVARWLERWRIPRTVAALLTLVGGLLLFFGVAAGTVTLVVAQLPDILDSAGEGVERLEELVGRVVPGFEVPAVDEIRGMILDRIETSDEGAGDFATQALGMVMGAVEVVAGMLLVLVILFFYLKSGRALAEGLAGFMAPGSRERIMFLAEEAWGTLGAYFRGQLLVALVDAVFIGIGLVLLGVPLALPLAVIVFFGGLFPIVGALATGTLAILVAFSDGGLGVALAVTGLVLAVQQLEGNVLEPLILSQVLDLNPLVIILSITLGAIVLGVLGAFLAVPTAAIGKRLIVRLRENTSETMVSEARRIR
jgi:putative heme transporter